MKQQAIWAWEERTKILSYLGVLLAQLGTSGIITNAKTVAWIAFAACAATAAASHLNDWLNKRKQEPIQQETPK